MANAINVRFVPEADVTPNLYFCSRWRLRQSRHCTELQLPETSVFF